MKLMDVSHSIFTHDIKLVLDTISWGALLGSMIDVLPHTATALTVIWMSMRIGETAYGWFKSDKNNNDKKE